jgi:quinol monooxygenase YgiN
MKFVRNLTLQVKPAKIEDFSRIMTNDVMPILKTQPGFAHELTMVLDNHVVAISVWNDKASAEKYTQNTYPRVLEKLNPVLQSQPVLETFDLAVASI